MQGRYIDGIELADDDMSGMGAGADDPMSGMGAGADMSGMGADGAGADMSGMGADGAEAGGAAGAGPEASGAGAGGAAGAGPEASGAGAGGAAGAGPDASGAGAEWSGAGPERSVGFGALAGGEDWLNPLPAPGLPGLPSGGFPGLSDFPSGLPSGAVEPFQMGGFAGLFRACGGGMYPGQLGTTTGQADGAGCDGMYAGHTGVADGLIGQFIGAACASGASICVHANGAPTIAVAETQAKRASNLRCRCEMVCARVIITRPILRLIAGSGFTSTHQCHLGELVRRETDLSRACGPPHKQSFGGFHDLDPDSVGVDIGQRVVALAPPARDHHRFDIGEAGVQSRSDRVVCRPKV
jgi:hypothetical protein